MKNRSIAQIIFINFFKTIGIILLLIGIGALSYYLTILILEKTARVERSTQYEHVIDVNTGNESSNLIYSYDDKSNEIQAMVLELFDCTTKNMTYVTIPANTQVTLSARTYRELLEKNDKIPQVITMAKINQYFKGDVAYEYGILALQEELKADIGYFTAMKSSEFQKCFEREAGKRQIYRPTQALLDEAAKNKDEDSMSAFIESKWDTLISDITLSQKQHYAKDLVQVNRDLIRTYRVRGTKLADVFKLNKEKNQKFIEKIWERKEYTAAQKKTAADAANMPTVFIYNGSQITGLAAMYQKRLEAEGYTVKGVGNATGGVRKTTTVYATKKKAGNRIAKFFKQAKVEQVSKTSSGAEIEIVLGTKDSSNS